MTTHLESPRQCIYRVPVIVGIAAAILSGALPAARAEEAERNAVRRQTLAEMQALMTVRAPESVSTGRINAIDVTWEDWQRRTGELPPDFDRMPSMAGLPDPLSLDHLDPRRPVRSPDDWAEKHAWIKDQFQHWVYGRLPPAPENLRVVVVREGQAGPVRKREVRLEFGPGHRAKLRVDLFIPPGDGPFPVYLTNQKLNRGWIAPAVRRGYIGVIFHAADPAKDDPDDSDSFIEAYPDYDFATLARRAFAGMRAVDYLFQLPEVDRSRIGLAGHSRNGKQALFAAAFDERIAAVIPSSGLTGEGMPWRYTGWDRFGTESIAEIVSVRPHWFHPRLRFFAGREHKLPVDQDSLMALVAPRGLMLVSGYGEGVGNAVGIEQAYRSARRVYDFMGRRENVALYLREGEHAVSTEDLERYVDFFDTVFGRGRFPRPETWIHGYDFEEYQRLSGERVDPMTFPARGKEETLRQVASPDSLEEKKADARRRLQWLLGDEPASVRYPARRAIAHDRMSGTSGALAYLFGRPIGLRPSTQSSESVPILFGDALEGALHFPRDASGKLLPGPWPVVVYLHPYTYARGYTHRYRMSFAPLLAQGCAVFSFDQVGFGTRMHEALRFYKRHPQWSLLGKMVADTRAALSALAALENIDPSRIYLLGFGLGGKIAVITAALDERPAAIASVAGFAPLRRSAGKDGAEGLAHYAHVHGLVPRLGFFIGHESRVPIDYDEILALAAPRPLLIVAPTRDRHAPVDDIAETVRAARQVYGDRAGQASLTLETPPGFGEFSPGVQDRTLKWLSTLR